MYHIWMSTLNEYGAPVPTKPKCRAVADIEDKEMGLRLMNTLRTGWLKFKADVVFSVVNVKLTVHTKAGSDLVYTLEEDTGEDPEQACKHAVEGAE